MAQPARERAEAVALTGRARWAAPRFVSVPAISGIRRAAAAAAPPWLSGPGAAPAPPGRRRARRWARRRARRRAGRPPAGCGAPRCPLQAPRGGGRRRARGNPPRNPVAGPGRGQRCCRAGVPPLAPPPRGWAGRCCGWGCAGGGSGGGLTLGPPGRTWYLPKDFQDGPGQGYRSREGPKKTVGSTQEKAEELQQELGFRIPQASESIHLEFRRLYQFQCSSDPIIWIPYHQNLL
ncbi:translation initiation factor IF-2-like [Apus apus]|uniref:translation initiation factor IF-2-like n=1 Tax=Apus apus TaxID=8895 RepID=UPI0021F90DBA|nr:translation initiation factor IF-2-like [Apus apus]